MSAHNFVGVNSAKYPSVRVEQLKNYFSYEGVIPCLSLWIAQGLGHSVTLYNVHWENPTISTHVIDQWGL